MAYTVEEMTFNKPTINKVIEIKIWHPISSAITTLRRERERERETQENYKTSQLGTRRPAEIRTVYVAKASKNLYRSANRLE
jgi:hypothetical protein